MNSKIKLNFDIPANDFLAAGEASSGVKKVLSQVGIDPAIIKRTSISMYEAEMNAVIHGGGGEAIIEIDGETILITIKDNGPGIPDIEMAMKEGFSTASDEVRSMGFGAGMGLPNIKRHSDKLEIVSESGKGTIVKIAMNLA